ncbi:CAP domain-containing protein [Sorangium cellulosum]|uniref:CAP domain-containing protein n=1 Tax=Sorangium cellulosum TaxID=56 RepID=UPI0013ECBF5E|nr:CAP domain-containing protein [Sorangium cellulosum]
MHRTLVLALLAGGSFIGCLGSTDVEPLDEELSDEQGGALESSICDTAWEGSSITLACPAGHVISAIEFASYGRPSGVCGSFRAGSCNASSSRSVVERACLGQASCTVRASDATFGSDPCRRSWKQLYAQARCTPLSPDGGEGGGEGGEGGGGEGGSGGQSGGGEVCGNGVCGGGEDCSSCASDCGACPACDGAAPDTTSLDAEEQAFLGIINQYRAQNGLGALSACTSMNRAAQGHSEDMRDQNYFSHSSLDGRSPWDRACNACYELGCGPKTAMAENIAAGNSGAQATFDQWKNSPGHNTNMLGSSFKVIGIGRATGGGTYRSYWTTVFGGSAEASCN